MRFENVNGVQYIVLDENDRVRLITKDTPKAMAVDVKCQNNGLNISGNPSIINTIKGDGMLEKVFVPPTLSASEIIEKCDQWLDMFKKVHDKFRELVLTSKYRSHNITMELSFREFFSYSDENIKGRKIDLDLTQNETIIQEGMTIAIDECNDKVYKYLIAKVLEHYLSVNYFGSIINNKDYTLYSNDKKQDNSNVAIICRLGGLYDSPEYARIVTSIITNHNLNQSLEQIIGNLKQEIYNQQMGERFINSFNHSTTQFGYIMPNSKKAVALSRKKK